MNEVRNITTSPGTFSPQEKAGVENVERVHRQDNHATVQNIYESTTNGQVCVILENRDKRTEVDLGLDDSAVPAVAKLDRTVNRAVCSSQNPRVELNWESCAYRM